MMRNLWETTFLLLQDPRVFFKKLQAEKPDVHPWKLWAFWIVFGWVNLYVSYYLVFETWMPLKPVVMVIASLYLAYFFLVPKLLGYIWSQDYQQPVDPVAAGWILDYLPGVSLHFVWITAGCAVLFCAAHFPHPINLATTFGLGTAWTSVAGVVIGFFSEGVSRILSASYFYILSRASFWALTGCLGVAAAVLVVFSAAYRILRDGIEVLLRPVIKKPRDGAWDGIVLILVTCMLWGFLGVRMEMERLSQAPPVSNAVSRLWAEEHTRQAAQKYAQMRAFVDSGRYQEALTAYEAFLRRFPKHATARWDQVYLLIAVEEYPRALAAIRSAQRDFPLDYRAEYMLAFYADRTGKPEQALRHYASFVSQTQGNRLAEVLVSYARTRMKALEQVLSGK